VIPDILDLSRSSHYFWALLPEIVLALWGMAILLVDVFIKGNRSEPSSPVIPWIAVSGLAVAALANGLLLPLWARGNAAPTGMVALDIFRWAINFVFLIAAAFCILLSTGYLDRRGINRGEFHALVVFATMGMMLLAGARDLMMLFIGLEVMSIAIYVLVGFDRMDARSVEGALKYFLLGAFASAFILYGIALTFGATGTTDVQALNGLLLAGERVEPMLMAGIALLLVGFAFKVAAIPFHAWAPDAYDGAPTPVTALMATGVKAAAFAAFIRVFFVAFLGHYEVWSQALFVLAALTMVVGNLIALTQGSVKRMLAYSSIAHAGYLLVAVTAANQSGAAAFLFYLLVYTLMTAGAFGVVIANGRGTDDRVRLEDFAGLASQRPWLAGAMAIFLLSLAGFPLTAGFLGKLYILRAAVEAQLVPLAVILVLASLLSYFYYLRLVIVMYMRPAASPEVHRDSRLGAPAMASVLAAAALIVVLFFGAGVRLTPQTASLLDIAAAGSRSLFASPAAGLAASPPPAP
jgi:NADH-quinone oxidoreductase subunit N